MNEMDTRKLGHDIADLEYEMALKVNEMNQIEWNWADTADKQRKSAEHKRRMLMKEVAELAREIGKKRVDFEMAIRGTKH